SITSVVIDRVGYYSVAPGGVLSATGGTGTGATFRLTFGPSSGDVFSVPTALNQVPLTLPYTTDSLPLIVTGPHVVSTSVPGNPASRTTLVPTAPPNTLKFPFAGDITPTSSTSANTSTRRGPVGPIPPYKVPPAATTPAAGQLDSTLTISDSL